MAEKNTGPPKPVTHTSLCEVAAMLWRDKVFPAVTGGPGITDQAVPSKCSTRGLAFWLLLLSCPTANTSLLAMAFTANNCSPPAKCGLGTTLHFVPLKC